MRNVSGTKGILRVSAVALICFTSPCAGPAVAGDSTNFPNPIHGGERWKIMEKNIDKIVGMNRQLVHKLFGGVDSLPNGVGNRQKEVIQLDSAVAVELEFNKGLVTRPTFVRSEEANRFWPFGESDDFVSSAEPANAEDPHWPAMRENLRNFIGMQRAKVEFLLGPDLQAPKSTEYGRYAVGNRSLFFWYENGIVTRFDLDDLPRRSNMVKFGCIRPPLRDKTHRRSQNGNQDKRDSANENLTWKLVQSHLQNLLCMNRKQIQAAFGQAKFISSRQHEDDLEGYEIEQDAVLHLLYNAGNVVYYEFIRPKDAQRFKLPVTVSGPHSEPSHRSNSDSSAQEIKNQTVFSSNLPDFIGMSRAEILTLFGAPRKEPRIKSDPEFDCEQGILAFSFDQDKVTKFSFRSYDIEAAVHSPPPTVKDARH
ncbi:MAG: hypothetical protein WCT03_08935 [Candidatus Obscuribacterales bacterium]